MSKITHEWMNEKLLIDWMNSFTEAENQES